MNLRFWMLGRIALPELAYTTYGIETLIMLIKENKKEIFIIGTSLIELLQSYCIYWKHEVCELEVLKNNHILELYKTKSLQKT